MKPCHVVGRIPARLRHRAVPRAADREFAGGLVADVAVDVGIDEVLRRHVEQLGCRPEVLERLREVQREDGCRRSARLQRRPLQADGVLARGGRYGCGDDARSARERIGRDRIEVVTDAREDRTVDRGADAQLDIVPARDPDRLGALLERDERAVAPIRVALDLLEIEVGDIGGQVREAPRDAGVVSDDHARHPGEAESRDVESAAVTDDPASQGHLVPHAGQIRAEVGVVRQQRHPALGQIPRDDPGVRPDAFAGVADERVDGRDDAVDLAPFDGCRNDLGFGGRGRAGRLHRRYRRHDHRIPVVRVSRIELRELLRGEVRRDESPLGLVLDVGPEVPGHGLQPRHRVFGSPRLDHVVGVLHPEDGVLERHVRAIVLGEVGVDARRVRVVVVRDGRVERGNLLRRDPSPPQRAQEGVGGQLRLPEKLGEPPAGDVPSEVHLPEAVLRMDVPLREEEVVGVRGRDRRDTELIALHVHISTEALHGDRPLQLRERPLDRPHDETGGDERDHDHAGDDPEHRCADDPSHGPLPGPHGRLDRHGCGNGLRH